MVTADPRLADDMARAAEGSSYADAVQRLLAVVRTQLDMDIAWVSEFVGSEQVLRFVDAGVGHAPASGTRLPLGGSFCARVLDGRFPALIPDTRQVPEAALLDVTAELHIGAYVGVPLVGTQGVATGMLCVVSERASPALGERDVEALRLLAGLLHDLQRRAVTASEAAAEQERLRDALTSVISGRGRHPVLQPIVDLSTGQVVAAEGLTRFTSTTFAGDRAPAQWFDDAGRLGLRQALELATARSVLDLADEVPPDVALTVNLSPETLESAGLASLLDGRPLKRVILEVTEHAPVADYDRLLWVLAPYRERGLQLAVDDTGAGYASLRHVLAVRPDLVKVDMALTRDVDTDFARQALLTALASFTASVGARLVAEGVETEAELAAARACGVDLAQGYLLGRPSEQPDWSPQGPWQAPVVVGR